MSIKNQATFWLKNVNDYNGEGENSLDISDGYREFSGLMKRIFEDYQSYEVSAAEKTLTKIGIMADDLENYHNLTETADCLFQMAETGVLHAEGNENYLEIEKNTFKKSFKGSVAFPFQMLENYSFYFRYYRNAKETTAYKSCDKFHLLYDDHAELIPAMKNLCEALPEINAKDDYIGKKSLLFSLADLDSSLLKNSTRQKGMNPLKPGIINTAGSKAELWREIAEKFINDAKFTVRAYINPYVFPNWTVKFTNKNKTVITFTITPGIIYAEMLLSYDAAKELIKLRKNLPKMINDSIDRFGCIGCGKCSYQSNIEIFEGVNLCKHSNSGMVGDSGRIVRGEIVSLEEIETIFDIAKSLL